MANPNFFKSRKPSARAIRRARFASGSTRERKKVSSLGVRKPHARAQSLAGSPVPDYDVRERVSVRYNSLRSTRTETFQSAGHLNYRRAHPKGAIPFSPVRVLIATGAAAQGSAPVSKCRNRLSKQVFLSLAREPAARRPGASNLLRSEESRRPAGHRCKKLAWNCATNMSWATTRAIAPATPAGARSRSNCGLPTVFPLSAFTQKQATTPLPARLANIRSTLNFRNL